MSIPPDRTDRISADEAIAPGRQNAPTGGTSGSGFQSYMQSPESATRGSPQTQGLSPAQVPQGPALQTTGPTPDSLLAQVSTSQDSLGNLRNQLNTKDLALKRSQQHLLRNKLSDASTYLRAANTKLGAETPQMPQSTGSKPLERFLNYVSDGENQLKSAQMKLQDMGKEGANLRPADFLLIQIKMNQAQQEIEYSSTLLSKVIASITQILNTQL